MFSFHRKPLLQHSAQVRPITIEGLEDRRMLSGSIVNAPSSSHGGGPGPQVNVATQVQVPSSGTVASVDAVAKTITVSASQHGTTANVTLNVDPNAIITADGAPVSLSALLAGANVSLSSSGKNAGVVTGIRAVGSDIEGTVSSVNTTAGTITLAGDHGGAATTFTVPASATITINNTPATLAGINTGAEIHLHLSALDNSTVVTVQVKNAAPANPNMPDVNDNNAFGSLVSVDAVNHTITVATSRGSGSLTQQTFSVDPNAVITADGTAITLAQLPAGVNVSLMFSKTNPALVTSITAIGKSIEGTVRAVDTTAGTITIAAEHNGGTQVLTIPATAVITINGMPGTLAQLTAGAFVQVHFSALDGTTILSVQSFAADI